MLAGFALLFFHFGVMTLKVYIQYACVTSKRFR